MTIESTTEAVAHFRALAPHLGRLEPEEQAVILVDWAQQEAHLDHSESVGLFDRAIDLYREAADRCNLGRTLTTASEVNRTFGRHANSLAYSTEAVELLERYGPSLDLAQALSQRALLEFIYTDADEAVLPWADRAMSIARELGDNAAMILPLGVIGNLSYSRGDMSGMALMEQSLQFAQETQDRWAEARTLDWMARMYGDIRDVERASDLAARLRVTAARYEMRVLESDALVLYAEFQMWKGDWESAENAATDSLGSNPSVQTIAWRVLGSIQARRGRNEARAAINRMWSLVRPEQGPNVADPAAAAVAEYFWLSDDRDPEVLQRLKEILAQGIAIGTPWPSGAFAFWMWKLGLLDAAPKGTADFYGWIIKGEYEKAAAFWHAKGIPYEEGLALMHGDEPEQIEAIRIFEDLGASATANKVRQALLDQGTRVPRGRSRATRGHAAGLTARQAEVLELLARGITNIEIADELFVSHRTVENHVSAVLMKLDVGSREAAVKAARDQGILDHA